MNSLPPHLRRATAFSLPELLVVVALIVMLVSMAANISRPAADLSAAGSRLASLFEQARDEAILQRQPTAVVMLTDGEQFARRVFAVLRHAAGTGGPGSWEQISRWERLPEGVLADNGGAGAFFPAHSPEVAAPLPDLTYQGRTFQSRSDYGYVIFMPDGRLFQDAAGSLPIPAALRLVSGYSLAGGEVRYTGARDSGGEPANYFKILLNESTGRVKIVRP